MRGDPCLHSVPSAHQFTAEDNADAGEFFRLPSHQSDEDELSDGSEFLLGPGLEALLRHFGARNVSAPASQALVDAAMPTFKLRKQKACGEGSDDDDLQCTVCREAFKIDDEVREMACKHMYHSDCILPWLALRRSCPLCRQEIMPAEKARPHAA